MPQLSAVEVITMVMCGEFFKLSKDPALFAYFRAHDRSFCPALTDRTLFVRHAANLWQLQAALQRRVVQVRRHATAPVPVIDPLPRPVCPSTRGGRRDHGFPGQADDGYCAAQQWHASGCKRGLRVTRCGLSTHDPCLAARPHDLQGLATLVGRATPVASSRQTKGSLTSTNTPASRSPRGFTSSLRPGRVGH
ncbi:MAG TPA: hypothetical protein VKK81_00500 [Candidatus Binatia bacterium]|nr:hypothetical protein [Candidatus Binatia bacterium]